MKHQSFHTRRSISVADLSAGSGKRGVETRFSILGRVSDSRRFVSVERAAVPLFVCSRPNCSCWGAATAPAIGHFTQTLLCTSSSSQNSQIYLYKTFGSFRRWPVTPFQYAAPFPSLPHPCLTAYPILSHHIFVHTLVRMVIELRMRRRICPSWRLYHSSRQIHKKYFNTCTDNWHAVWGLRRSWVVCR